MNILKIDLDLPTSDMPLRARSRGGPVLLRVSIERLRIFPVTIPDEVRQAVLPFEKDGPAIGLRLREIGLLPAPAVTGGDFSFIQVTETALFLHPEIRAYTDGLSAHAVARISRHPLVSGITAVQP